MTLRFIYFKTKDKVSFKIRLAVFQASGSADPPAAEHL
jgi:hypothetical protein